MRELPSRGLSVFTTERGDRGPRVLFVPGAGADHVGWGLLMRALRDDVRGFAFDPRGTGRTAGDASQTGVHVLAADLAALIETFDEPVHVVAHSLGTRVAMAAAARLSDRVASLFLFGPWYRSDPFMQHRIEMLMEICLKGDRRIAAQTILWLLTSRALQVDEPERFAHYVDAMFLGQSATPWSTVVRQLGAGRESPVSEEEIAAIRCPVRVAIAEADRMIEPPASEALARRLGVDPVRFTGPRASHLAHVEMPDAVAAAVRAWLGEVVAG